MFTRRIAVSISLCLLAACGGGQTGTPTGASGASGTGVPSAQTAAPSTGASGMPAAAGASGMPAPAAGIGAIAGAPSLPAPAAGSGGFAGTPSAPTPAAGSGGLASTPETCATDNLTYADFAAPFFASHCNRCHGQGDAVPRIQRPPREVTFNSEADLVRSKERIRKIVIKDQRMPPGQPVLGCLAEQLSKYLDALPSQ